MIKLEFMQSAQSLSSPSLSLALAWISSKLYQRQLFTVKRYLELMYTHKCPSLLGEAR